MEGRSVRHRPRYRLSDPKHGQTFVMVPLAKQVCIYLGQQNTNRANFRQMGMCERERLATVCSWEPTVPELITFLCHTTQSDSEEFETCECRAKWLDNKDSLKFDSNQGCCGVLKYFPRSPQGEQGHANWTWVQAYSRLWRNNMNVFIDVKQLFVEQIISFDICFSQNKVSFSYFYGSQLCIIKSKMCGKSVCRCNVKDWVKSLLLRSFRKCLLFVSHLNGDIVTQ